MPSVMVFRRWFGGEDAGAWSCVFDVVEAEEVTLETEVTENPVEVGTSLADHAFERPIKLVITAAVSDVPPPGMESDLFAVDGSKRSVAAFAWLDQKRRAHEPFSVQTGLKLYPSMLITSLRVKQDKDSSAINRFSVELREIQYATTQTILYPARPAKTKRTVAPKIQEGEKPGNDLTDEQKAKARKSFLKLGIDFLSGAAP